MKRLRLVLVLISSFFAIAEATAQPCLSYGPAVVKITGLLQERKTPNVNNETASPKGKWDTFLAVVLKTPVCVSADSDNDAASNIRVMELVNLFEGKQFKTEFARWKKFAHDHTPVVVTGKLYHADNGNQHTGVLIEVLSVEESH